MGLLTTIRDKYELYRLEQRYTRRDKRTTFTSSATYVDGEYIYAHGPPALNPGEGVHGEDMDFGDGIVVVDGEEQQQSARIGSGASTGAQTPRLFELEEEEREEVEAQRRRREGERRREREQRDQFSIARVHSGPVGSVRSASLAGSSTPGSPMSGNEERGKGPWGKLPANPWSSR